MRSLNKFDPYLGVRGKDLPESIQISKNTEADFHGLLERGHALSNLHYKPIALDIQMNVSLKDSIRIISGYDSLRLIVGDENNKTVAVYSYLDLLGYKFYGPENHWTHFPEIKGGSPIDTTIVSYFPFRRIAVSYGLSKDSTPSLDRSLFLYKRWKDRLRMVNLWNIPAGHYGKTFNEKYKEVIETHPEWMGNDKNGNAYEWYPNLKLCYWHPEVIELYKKDALERLNAIKANRNPPYIINMEPPDGGLFCEFNGSISDQVFGLADAVAKFLYQHDESAYVSLYGYSYHASIPSFPMHPNVIVGIAPRMVRSGGSPEKMARQWEDTPIPIYLRGYLAIPPWTMNKADYSPKKGYVKEIDHLKENGYLGYNMETTASFMSVGLKFHLLSSASWREVDEEKEYQEFLSYMFPGYEEEVSMIYELLPKFSRQNIITVLSRIRNLKNRISDVNNALIKQRLDDLEFYAEYLYLLDEYEREKDEESINGLLDKIMSEPGSRLLHPFGLYHSLKRDVKIARPIMQTINKTVRIKEAQEFMFNTRNKQKERYMAMNPEFYIDTLSDFFFIPVKDAHGIMYVGNHHNGKVKFNARLEPRGYGASGTIIIRDMKDHYIDEIVLVPDDVVREFELKLPIGHFYKIQFLTPETELHLQGPNRPFVFTEALFTRYIYQDAKFYFRVPQGVSEVKMHVPRQANKVIVNRKSETVHSNKQDDAYDFSIFTQGGDIIEVIMRRNGLKLLNIPHYLSIHEKGIIYETDQ